MKKKHKYGEYTKVRIHNTPYKISVRWLVFLEKLGIIRALETSELNRYYDMAIKIDSLQAQLERAVGHIVAKDGFFDARSYNDKVMSPKKKG